RPRSLSARRVLRRREFRALGQRQREPACGAIRLPMSRVQDSMSSLTRAAGPTHSTGPAALLSLKREIVVGGLSALLVRPATHLVSPPEEVPDLDGVQTCITDPAEAGWERCRYQNGGLSYSTGEPVTGSIFRSHSARFLPGTLDSDTVMSITSPGCSLRPNTWAALRMAI